MNILAAVISALLGVGLIVAAILGPLGMGIIEFNMNRNATIQYEGGEVVTILATLFLFNCAWLWWFDSRLAPAFTMGPAIYAVYTMVTVVMGQEFTLFPNGNAERYFLLFMGLTGLGVTLIVLATNSLIQQQAGVSDGWRRGTQWVLGIQAAFFAFTWISQIIASYRDGFTAEQTEARLLFWLIKYLDLGFMIPMALIAIVLLQYHQPLAHTIVIALSGFFVWMMLAIAGMSVSQYVQDEPGGSLVLAGMFVVMAAASAVVFVNWARSMTETPV